MQRMLPRFAARRLIFVMRHRAFSDHDLLAARKEAAL